uniref:Uncharacterized protein n=1 Tax=Arundo donax TaxID=35708 RepID=A0A0A8Y9A0_ARUDO
MTIATAFPSSIADKLLLYLSSLVLMLKHRTWVIKHLFLMTNKATIVLSSLLYINRGLPVVTYAMHPSYMGVSIAYSNFQKTRYLQSSNKVKQPTGLCKCATIY